MEEYWLKERARAESALKMVDQQIMDCNKDFLVVLESGDKNKIQEENKKFVTLIQERKYRLDAYKDADAEAVRAAWFRLTGR